MSSPHRELTIDGISDVSVLFYLHTGDDWPPYPGEVVAGRLLTPFVVEVTGIPQYAYGISRGDLVAVTHDGSGFLGRHVKQAGGHSTVRVVATTADELAPIAAALVAAGAAVQPGTETTMLAVDVPAEVDLVIVESIVSAAVSMTCNYEIAADSHLSNGATR